MENIEEILKDKNFNSKTLYYINNFIEEFDEFFGKYVSRDEVIRRIKENLNENIEFVDFERNGLLGRYIPREKKILIRSGLSEEKLKAIFFHEMIHCITTRDMCVGFDEVYDVQDIDAEELEINKHCGSTEGFTVHVSSIRDEKYGGQSTGYPILAEQTRNLIEIVGEEEYLEVGFNNPSALLDLMQRKGLVKDEEDLEEFLDNFDIIWKNEEDIIATKYSPARRIWASMLGLEKEVDTPLAHAKESLVKIFSSTLAQQEISSIEELVSIYNKIKRYASQLDIDNGFDLYDTLWTQIKNLEQKGIKREDILNAFNVSDREMIEAKFKFDEFMALDRYEKLAIFANSPEQVYDEYIYEKFDVYCTTRITQSILGENIKEPESMFYQLDHGLAKMILNNGYNLDTLSFEFLTFENSYFTIYNLYDTNGEKTTYLGTYGDSESNRFLEFDSCIPPEIRAGIIEKYPEFESQAMLFRREDGYIIAYDGEEQYTLIDSEKDRCELENVSYVKSTAESLIECMQKNRKRYQVLKMMLAPQIILDDLEGQFAKLSQRYSEINLGMKILPQEIESLTMNVSLDDIEKTLANFSDSKQVRKKVFEEGIGYENR